LTNFDYDPAAGAAAGERCFILSGCSGGGKSTLLEALARRGLAVYREPGRQIVREQLLIGGGALPSADPLRFVELVASRTMFQRAEAARHGGVAVFDRGLVDCRAYLVGRGIAVPSWLERALDVFRHNRLVFMVPPWREIYVNDAERMHSFHEARREYDGLAEAYALRGCELVILPRLPVEERVEAVLRAVADAGMLP
jgi:predicted ATPase